MRGAASLLLCAAGVLTGLLLRDRLRQKTRIAHALCRMVREIGSRALYLRQPLPQIVSCLAQDASLSGELPFLADCVRRCDALPFPAAWQDAAAAFLRTHRLRGFSPALLEQMGFALAAADEKQLAGLLDWYLCQFRSLLQSSQHALDNAGKTILYVCSAVGLLLGILIL